MSETSQSLIKVYINQDNNAVLVYGNSDNCDIQHLELDTIIIKRADLMAISQALASATFIEEEEELQNGES